jgi:DNA-binding transcriptional LysR family regulator
VVARAAHPLAGRRVAGPDLAAYPWVLPRRETPSRAMFDRLAAEDSVADPARGHVETGSLVALRGLLLASDALALISPRQVVYELQQGLLTTIDYPLPAADRPIGVTTLADWQPTALMSAFLDVLHAQV